MLPLTRFTEEELRSPDRREEVDAYIQSLKEAGCPSEAEYWQARQEGDAERATRALRRVENPPSSEPTYWQDPERRAFLATYVEWLHTTDPVRAAWYQAKLDGDETTARRIIVQSEVFSLQRVLNQTPESDPLGRQVVEAWKKSQIEQARR